MNFWYFIIVLLIFIYAWYYLSKENYLADYGKYKFCACRKTMEDIYHTNYQTP